ncbi:MAG: O-acetylserine/cysteine exporter [Opitutus sp.]|nr:O-acetylserine/cysteine exporter [Opitutus sp.]
MPSTLPLRSMLLALIVVAIWGSNFVAIKLALVDLPPLLLCAVRFVAVSVPLVFFLPRPAITWGQLTTYGLSMFGAQFAFMFVGMKLGMPAGLASLVLQFQVFVSLALSVVLLRERVLPVQIGGALVAAVGFVIVALHTGGDVTVAGLVCVLLAAVSWGFANVTSRRLGKVNPLALVVWGGLVVPLPMGIASLVFEGREAIWHGLTHAGAATWLSVAYTVYLSTLVAYSLWSWLLSHYPASTVTPFTLLVPVLGMLSSALFLGETLPGWKLQAAAFVIAGLVLSVFGPRLRFFRPAAAATPGSL